MQTLWTIEVTLYPFPFIYGHPNLAKKGEVWVELKSFKCVREFTIRFNTNGLGLRSNAIKDLCPLILYQLVVGWIGKAHSPTSGIRVWS